MRRFSILLLAVLSIIVFCLVPVGALADTTKLPPTIREPSLPNTSNLPATRRLDIVNAKPINIAFSPVPTQYNDISPSTIFDLSGDLVGDIIVGANTVSGKNGAKVQLLDPAVLNLDQVYSIPAIGYNETAPIQLSRVYVVQLSGGGYAKFILLQASPKVTIWFHYGQPTSSVLKADGDDGHAVLTWNALPDATLGYNIYRYEVFNNSYTVVCLNDFAVKETTFTDNTAENRYYLYLVQAVKNNGATGTLTTVAPVFIHSLACKLVISPDSTDATLNEDTITLDAAPEILDGKLMIPASLLVNAGVKVTYDSATDKLTLTRRLESVTYIIYMTTDAQEYSWNGTTYKSDVPPYLNGDEVYVPLRVVAPILGLGVTFNSVTMEATIGWYE